MTRAATLALFLFAGCAGSESSSSSESVARPSAPAPVAVAPAPAPSVIVPPPPTPVSPATATDRRAALEAMQPTATRAGHLRFATDAIHDPLAATVFLERLARRDEPEGVRAALAEALPRTGGVYADALETLIAAEPSARVRAALVDTAGRAEASAAGAVIRRGLADPEREVQLAAARAAAAHPQGATWAPALRATLTSGDAEVRAEVARTLGVHKVTMAKADLVRLLDDTSPEVRLAALRAVDRVEPGALRGSAALGKLVHDRDDRIARLASELQAR